MPLIGDLIAQTATKLGVKSCVPCQARQEKMNQAHQNLNDKVKSVLKNFGKPSGSGTSDAS